MAFPRRLLRDGEELVLDLRPHWIALAFPVFVTVVAVAAAAVLTAYVHTAWLRLAFWVVAALAVVIWAVPKTIQWATSHFVVTSERIIHRTGLISKHAVDIPLDRLQNVKFGQSVFERIIGAGDLTLESAGETGETSFDHVRNPERVQKVIYDQREQDEQARLRPVVQAAAGSASVADELAKLEQLRRQGVISDTEFDAQKARLLGSA
jgi:uncharacterized membrane protein YdbT with pleckstrin-like domain